MKKAMSDKASCKAMQKLWENIIKEPPLNDWLNKSGLMNKKVRSNVILTGLSEILNGTIYGAADP
ncbi:MAG: hypothetical protein HQL29_00080 [Candidatus Omnitrophica bacterium]|nr:hypothetical protein [Candidatus Omnitrophota bacterium]